MRFNDWLNEIIGLMNRGGGIDKDGAFGFQCMDLYNDYMLRVGELTGNTGADRAKNILQNNYVTQNCEVIKNYPEFVPEKGDIAVFTGSLYGHVSICTGEGNTKFFKSIDQNWVSQHLSLTVHNYESFAPLYFLRLKDRHNILDKVLKSLDEVAQQIINGEWGNGDIRVKALKDYGYSDEFITNVQNKVNEILTPTPEPVKRADYNTLAREIIDGKYGNGEERIANLKAAGYNDKQIENAQNKVNEVLAQVPISNSKKSNEEIAKECIDGLWGNGEERYKRVTDAGYDYNVIQEIINSML